MNIKEAYTSLSRTTNYNDVFFNYTNKKFQLPNYNNIE